MSTEELRKTMTSVDLSSYRDQHFKGSRGEQERLLRQTTTLYVGNMSFYTTEEQIYELFGMCGEVKRVVMGLDKFKSTPCGFCFVEYYNREDSAYSISFGPITWILLAELFPLNLKARAISLGQAVNWTANALVSVTFLDLVHSFTLPAVFTRLDDRIIRTDFDAGFIEGRQYGRGKSGGQVRDEYRTDFDSGRGGYGKIVQQKLEVVDYLS